MGPSGSGNRRNWNAVAAAGGSARDRTSGVRVSSLPTWAMWSIAVVVLLSPVLAFLTSILVEILISLVKDAGVLALLTLAVAGALGWVLLRMRSPRLRGKASVQA